MPEVKGMEEPIKSGSAGEQMDKCLKLLGSIGERLDSIEEEDKKRDDARRDKKRRHDDDDDHDNVRFAPRESARPLELKEFTGHYAARAAGRMVTRVQT